MIPFLFRRRRRHRKSTIAAVGAVLAGLAGFAPALGLDLDRLAGLPAAVLASGVSDQSSAAGASVDPRLTGRPTHITDGDTFRFGTVRVRLHGVNAPEMDTPDGPRARVALMEAIGGDEVRCEDTGQRSYNRVVAVCFDAQGRDLAERMVLAGWAKDWPKFSQRRYALAEAQAFIAGRGVYRR